MSISSGANMAAWWTPADSGSSIGLRAIGRGTRQCLPPPNFDGEVKDDLLRMLFVCCSEAIPRDSQLVLALKTLCGFSTAEIALRLFTTQVNVHERLSRARDRLREDPAEFETPPGDQ